MKPLITSNLWNDFYTYSQFQMIFNQFPRARARYKVQDRQIDRPYPKDMDARMAEQLSMLSDVRTTSAEYYWLLKQRITKPTCAEFFLHYQFKPSEVFLQYGNPVVKEKYKEVATIEGPMYRVLWWEMPMILLTSCLCTQGLEKRHDWKEKIGYKGVKLDQARMNWIDFGTRRAFDMETQREVVRQHKHLLSTTPDKNGWRGTSNMCLAMEEDVPVQGTISHMTYMMMQAAYGFRMSNQKATEHWIREYEGDLGIALTDTLTTDVFLRDFNRLSAEAWRGFRLDSGRLADSAKRIAGKLRTFDIDPTSKIYVPSDSLTDDSSIAFRDELAAFFGKPAKVTAGVGTFMVNDCGYDPRKVVCKLDAIDIFGNGDWVDVVKLSDEPGKYSGKPERVAAAKAELGLA